jgi:hypothetical protein
MKLAAQFTFKLENGAVPPVIRRDINETLKRLATKAITVTVGEAQRQRSRRQNSFYWGVVLPAICEMFRDAGSDASKDEVHLFLKRTVGGLTRAIVLPGGGSEEVVRSSSDLAPDQWEEWQEKIRAWAAEWGTELPMPNEDL